MANRGRGHGGSGQGNYRGGGQGNHHGGGQGNYRGGGQGNHYGDGHVNFHGGSQRGRGGRGGQHDGVNRGQSNFRGSANRGGGGSGGGRGGSEAAKVYRDGVFTQPDAEVTRLEKDMVSGDTLAKALATAGVNLPARPTYGDMGKAIVLHTNYFELKCINPKTDLYVLSVTFIPEKKPASTKDEKPSKGKTRRLMEILLNTSSFANLRIATDWSQTLIAPHDIPRGDYKLEWYPADGDPLPAATPNETTRRREARKENTFTARVAFTRTVSVDDLLEDLAGPSSNYAEKIDTIQALNIVMTNGPSRDPNIVTAGGNRFYPFRGHSQIQSKDLGCGLLALRGYFSSVRTSVNRILVNVNVATGAFHKAGSLLDLMREMLGKGAIETMADLRTVRAFFKMVKIETVYLKKRKVHIIVDWSSWEEGKGIGNAQNTLFTVDEGKDTERSVSVEAYFRNKYQIILQCPSAPLVNTGTKKDPNWIPLELCRVIPGQLAKKLLSGSQTREMIAFAARKPHENAHSITNDGLRVTKIVPMVNGTNPMLQPFGIKVSSEMLTVHGRVLDPPTLQYTHGLEQKPKDGAWNLKLGSQPFNSTKSLGVWGVVVLTCDSQNRAPHEEPKYTHHLGLFRDTLAQYVLQPGRVPRPVFINIYPNQMVGSKIREIIAGALSQKNKPSVLFVLLPDERAVLYDSIKYVLDVQKGWPNICSLAKKFTNENYHQQKQYFANIAMKVNQKLGGINHTLNSGSLAPLDDQTILFGIDVTHPSPGSADAAPSIAGVVASVDGKFSQFPGSMSGQTGTQEMVTNLKRMIVERLALWMKRNNQRLPNKVVVYRDGVSEGQYNTVLNEEYPAFREAFAEVYTGKMYPKMSIIMVGKRHHTRFYPTRTTDMDLKTGNPQPGTVVDRGVTGEKLFDFFLIAHQGLQGTSKPAHYVVLKDEIGLDVNQLQRMTYNLCYTFARATRSVSICPPVFYADLLCERGRCYLHSVFKGDSSVPYRPDMWKHCHSDVKDTMYYL